MLSQRTYLAIHTSNQKACATVDVSSAADFCGAGLISAGDFITGLFSTSSESANSGVSLCDDDDIVVIVFRSLSRSHTWSCDSMSYFSKRSILCLSLVLLLKHHTIFQMQLVPNKFLHHQQFLCGGSGYLVVWNNVLKLRRK